MAPPPERQLLINLRNLRNLRIALLMLPYFVPFAVKLFDDRRHDVDEIKIAFIGAGDVNFGGGEGPWDHASRLEKIDGVRVVGVADPDVARANRQLAARQAGPAAGRYAGAAVFADFAEMLGKAGPDAVFIGVPPRAHGRVEFPADIELVCAAAGVHIFIEKPLGCAPPEEMSPLAERLANASARGLVVSVGYMFRYARAIDAMRQLLEETPGGPRAVIGRYDCAYSEIGKADWWDIRRSGGPIVEQATHFVDLMRLLAGEALPETVSAVTVEATEPAGALADAPLRDGLPIDADVPSPFRPPRATAAVWKFAGGAVGSLTHATLLHRKKYESELEVWGDGLRMVLADPYGACRLHVRRPGQEATETIDFAGDDPYLTEDRAFIEAVRTGDASAVRSAYADAMKTYELTWTIRRAGEE